MTRVTTDDEGDVNTYIKSLNIRLELTTVCILIILYRDLQHNEMWYVSTSEADTWRDTNVIIMWKRRRNVVST